jgi:hypothetical protein
LVQGLKSAFFDNKGVRALDLFTLIGMALYSGIFFAIRDYGKVNPVVSFFAGSISGPLALIIPFGSLVAGFALSLIISDMIGPAGRKRLSDVRMAIIALVGFAIAFAIAVNAWKAASWLPLVGKQMSYFAAKFWED